MSEKKLKVSKEVGIATAVGAGLGALRGIQNNSVVSDSLLGAGVGALVGLFGASLLVDTNQPPKVTEEKSPENN